MLGSLASDVEDIEANAAATADAVNDISEDMGYIEDFIDTFEDDEDDEEEYDDDDDDDAESCGCCGMCGGEEDDGLADGEEEEDETIDLDGSQMYEVTCPACGDVVTVDESILSLGKIECPGCGNILEFDLGDDEE